MVSFYSHEWIKGFNPVQTTHVGSERFKVSQIDTIFSHVPKGTTTTDPFVSESHLSISARFLPLFNLFGKEIETRGQGD